MKSNTYTNIACLKQKFTIKVRMDCRIAATYKFQTILRFKRYDVVLTKKQSVMANIICSFVGDKMQT